MKKLGLLLVLLSVGSFMTGCDAKKTTPESTPAASEGSDKKDAGDAPADTETPAAAPDAAGE